ncbi:MAG: DUF87 domain-containing protein, partial [Lewinellaceae bacterium]|nr:DUF87 domain-containing protein [Lewinellaceae bacterium]
MLDFGKIYSEFDEEFKPDCNIEVGHVVGYIPELVVRFMETWCFRLDLVMEHDKKVNGGHTEVSDELLRYRGFTYSEYKDLFDATIPSERYLHYPAYERLDIQSDIERNRFILGKTYEQDNYVKALETCDVREVLSFFFKDFPACVALDDLFMNTSIIAPPGSGKTFMMRTWLHRLINKYKDFSFVIIDPHGDVARKLFESTLLRDRERFIYLDPKFINDGYSFTYNIFDIKDISPLTENQTVDQIEDAITELVTSDSTLSTSIASVLSHCIYFLIQRGNSTIQDLYDLITVKQPILAEAQRHDSYFANNFVKSDSRSRDAIERRISRLVTGLVPRSLLSGKSTFNLEEAINSNKVVIVNLAGLGQLTRDAVGKFI